MSETTIGPLEHRNFLQRPINFILTLAVVATTIFSIFNINSICIMLLVAARLWDGGPIRAVKAAFSNKYFLSYLALFLVDALGLLYTHNLPTGGHIVEKGSTLVAVSFVLCGGVFANERNFKKLMTSYCLILLVASLYCLAVATRHYMEQKTITVFFYHPFSHAIFENAIYFSVFMIFGLLFLLSDSFSIGTDWLSLRSVKMLRVAFILFFTGIIILLASKLLLIMLILILVHFAIRKLFIRKNALAMLVTGITGLLLFVGLAFTDNPIKERYMDIAQGNVSMYKKDKFSQETYFNGVQLRLLQLRYAFEILNENHSWVYGVSPGDSQDLLNKKYIHADMYTGDPSKNSQGFLTYNFHNQYIQYLVNSGIIGLGVFLFNCGLLIGIARKWRTREAFFTVAILLSLFFTESFITLQHGVFLYSFFPLLLLYSPRESHPFPKKGLVSPSGD
jgi:O-antigen ligase